MTLRLPISGREWVRTSSLNAALVTMSKLRSYLKSSPGLLTISSRRAETIALGLGVS